MTKNNSIPKNYSRFRDSAVLILIDSKGRLILTKRTRTVKSHKGQFSFPGGKKEEKDKDFMETALRETEEEIGISREWIKNIRPLAPSFSPRGFVIKPYLGFLKDHARFHKSEGEVEKIVRVPFQFFQKTNPFFRIYNIKGVRVRADFYHYGRHVIWGATARMISMLKMQGIKQRPFEKEI